mmetsp:Transcript_21117/g.30529  ORF Transcript_21117/g.30529 Transcript_21117/m.30529 type:complete len:316 (+) Transcript_21117:123-1070(+)|eukprot:CAMPEP_0185027248 /NCGR_PEP_ID=MMETSP1103-20130426/12052_1 /TAXON_ID=36769 /ORGANISM="Paraphysomonas bandaiensis, Strain Caron Lab Isolate" /LENGTH=315 /DNA_ID=CAMNT_0027561145 /DNA_START=38 /DNA_END=985 /DNA_ORIENTATION=-
MPYQGGLFSPPITNSVGDPYYDKAKHSLSSHGSSKGLRQFGVGKGIPGKFNRLYEGETHIDNAKVLAAQRLKGRQGFLTPNGFSHPSSLKKSSSVGDYNGTFTKPYQHMPEGRHEPRNKPREAKKEIAPRKIYTNPPRKATGGQASTPKIHFTETEYVASEYDAYENKERELHRTSRELMDGKPPFKVSVEDILGKPLSDEDKPAVSTKPFTSPISRPHTTQTAKGDGESKAFRPSSPSKAGGPLYGTFSEYPAHLADPYDEKKIRTAMLSTRLLPMVQQEDMLDEKIKDRRAWAPSSPPKAMYTRSTLFRQPGK